MTVTVFSDYANDDPNPIELQVGDTVQVGEESNPNGPYPNWIFCTSDRTGYQGWVAKHVLAVEGSVGKALDDYTSKEMTVAAGDEVQPLRELNGWYWCLRPKDGETGWVAKDNLGGKAYRAVQLLEKCDSVQLAAINWQGYPRVCEMERVKSVGLSELFFTTPAVSAKVAYYMKNKKAGVSYCFGGDSVSLVGSVEIVRDMETKKEVWQNGHEHRFATNNDGTPKYCLLKFTTAGASVFMDGKKETL